jgi:hypothetical protein
MQQKSGDHCHPLGFFWKKLNPTKSHYSTFDRKLLAAYLSIRHFRHLWRLSVPDLDGPQAFGNCHVSIHTPHFHAPTTPLSFYFRVQCANALPAWPTKCHRRFSFSPSFNPWQHRRNRTATLVGFGAMTTKQNLCPKMQRLLGGASLTIALKQVA